MFPYAGSGRPSVGSGLRRLFLRTETDYHVRPTRQDQEKAPGRNRPALPRAQRRASQGDRCRPRPRRPLRKRRVQVRQGTPGLRQPQDRPSQKAHGRSQHAEPQQYPEGPLRIRFPAHRSDMQRDVKIDYKLVSSEEADAEKGLISTTSPIGKALLNRKVGDEIEVATPAGKKEFEIVRLVTIHDGE